MIPDLDSQIGISVYSTNFPGIGGKIRMSPDDFQVREIISKKKEDSISDQDGYAVYKLKKKNIDTNHALSGIFNKKGIRLKSLGLKDASAITEQFVCSGNKGRAIENFSTDKYSLEKIGYVKKPLSKKDMIGNHFKIKISECSNDLSSFTEYDKILNFYGYQRFGSKRAVTHLIGKALLKRDFKKAVELILCFTSTYDSEENTEIREKLSDPENYEKYFDQVPPQMDIERIVLKEMIDHNDPIRAIRAIPVSLRRFYVQAYQSFIFNQSLSSAFLDGENLFEVESGDVCFDFNGIIGKYVKGMDQNLALPFVGYSYYKKTRFDYQISKILQSEEISPKDFFIKEMQEVSSEGGFRQAAIHCFDYSAHETNVEFSLSRGSFATIVLREIMKPQDPIVAGF
ncbi:tRNA pseudouridine synthase D [Candidatus Nitrosopumilus salaria BD31]|uniref:tRNA pseudouridine synthase D n=1 Tax=Candidatus Nitrosopumilus salarius BD31 TaxID=859350 RepID=I3D3Z9_9ARCH|nr:tRNA pseudouridine(13) synthase TruD [Candidatus Nitrosopumilus salaria]EIJ66442.1 tRNA pseudouridine synthase D [Candidatus Nitrosopumilus salaria BD31]